MVSTMHKEPNWNRKSFEILGCCTCYHNHF